MHEARYMYNRPVWQSIDFCAFLTCTASHNSVLSVLRSNLITRLCDGTRRKFVLIPVVYDYI